MYNIQTSLSNDTFQFIEFNTFSANIDRLNKNLFITTSKI